MLVNCRNCKNEFDKKIAEIKRTKNHYCSKSCKGEFLSSENISNFYKKAKYNGECLEWQQALNKDGYGVVRYKGKVELAHRVSYVILNGDIADGKSICHKCDNPKCVNPKHLFIGSHSENMEDMRVKGRKWSKLTFDDVSNIRNSNLKDVDLAKTYRVSPRTIRYARNKTNWMPLPKAQKE